MKRDFKLLAIVLLIIGVCTAYFFYNYESYEEKVYVGMRGEAGKDHLYALKKMIVQLGGTYQDHNSGIVLKNTSTAIMFDSFLAKADPSKALIVLTDRRHIIMTDERVKALRQWVERGGHAVIEAEQPEQPDPLLASMDLDRESGSVPDSSNAPNPNPNTDPSPSTNTKNDSGGKTIKLPNIDRVFRAKFLDYQQLVDQEEDRDIVRLSDDRGLRVVQLGLGQGRITVISNFDFMTRQFGRAEYQSTHIGLLDHAELFWRFCGDLRDPNSTVRTQFWFIEGHDEFSSFAWFWDYGWKIFLVASVLLIAWLWHVAPRFGPLLVRPNIGQVSITHHIDAVGRFIWKHAGAEALFQILRKDLADQIAVRRPAWVALDNTSRAKALANLVDVTTESVMQLNQVVQTPAEFLRGTQLIQKIRAKL